MGVEGEKTRFIQTISSTNLNFDQGYPSDPSTRTLTITGTLENIEYATNLINQLTGVRKERLF
jgi:hypothetical protein